MSIVNGPLIRLMLTVAHMLVDPEVNFLGSRVQGFGVPCRPTRGSIPEINVHNGDLRKGILIHYPVKDFCTCLGAIRSSKSRLL